MRESKEDLEAMIERALAEQFPEIELVDLEVRGGRAGTVTVYVDRPEGVDLETCAAVSRALDDVRELYRLEVSSPGLNRRLRKPAHFAAALGGEVAVKTSAPREGRRNFRGLLTAADETTITLDLGAGVSVTLPLATIASAHVVYNFERHGGQRE